MLSSRSEVRRSLVRACARSRTRVHDLLIDEWVDQVLELRDFYENEVIRLKAMFDAEIGVLRREIGAMREPQPLPSNVVELRER
jgi:hypothetical protein